MSAVWVSGRVVRDDGKAVRPTQIVKVKEGEFKDDAMKALGQLFEQLKIGELPAERPVEPKVAEVPVLVPVPEVRRVVDTGEGQRTVGRAMFIGGVAVAAVGGALLTTGQVIGAGLTPDDFGNLPIAQRASYSNARSLSTAGVINAAAGGGVALIGALIWGLSPTAPAVRLSAAAGPSGAAVLVQGDF